MVKIKVCANCELDMYKYKCKCKCYCDAYLEDYLSDSKIKVCAACNTYDKYNSLYIGKDIGKALIELLF
jgi:hypothetical protein